jgi:hypothetical protein
VQGRPLFSTKARDATQLHLTIGHRGAFLEVQLTGSIARKVAVGSWLAQGCANESPFTGRNVIGRHARLPRQCLEARRLPPPQRYPPWLEAEWTGGVWAQGAAHEM